MPLIDFHTHKLTPPLETVSVRSVSAAQEAIELNGTLCTLGIHPWDSGSPEVESWLIRLDSLAGSSNVIGIGEVGLDKLRGTALDTQERLLMQQVAIAEKHTKPIIIHCVRAWDRIIGMPKKIESTIAYAIHGFRGNAKLAQQLVDGGFYLSFGSQLVNATQNLMESIRGVPIEKLFLETDDSEVGIDQVYQNASQILGYPIEFLEAKLERNFRVFFNYNPKDSSRRMDL